ncbi:MAG: phosphoenolpyruvate synthase [Methanomicrobiales archaeon]|jgi:pyruvate,water dikinase|nr:phosphoenolpyruvate synthase [Methanomicrobiales archaeon]HNI41305.1 phosphoenolpyruvate synthase [Methanoregulaceae archaeon]HNW80990.1 phosphoenolpyruvate synthase [Methanoregulaceae archaeon]HPA08220.1 phosphoenolpyruvate synthase [Methanoregulaceae archaeon]HPS23478.1 phosphoenolpyruvate synthase [Methanoregulaceae archaeon]
MKEMPDILWLEEIRKEDIAAVGGKGASLGEMSSMGLPVPGGFVVTSRAFRHFLIETGIEQPLFSNLENLNVDDNNALEQASKKARALVMKAKMPASLKDRIRESYQKLNGGGMVVAVRSSATAEDLPDASFAGQQETYLNIKGEKNLLDAVQKCWASLYGARAIYYRAKQGFDDRSVNIAVVVQQMINSEKAGVMFTSHPVTGEPLTIIEGSWGLGEAVVSGSVSPDKYVYDQRTGNVIDKLIAQKKTEIVSDGEHGTKTLEIGRERQETPVLSDDEVARLATYGKVAETHYGIPQDVEWSIVGDTIYILQSRPITTIRSGATSVKTETGEGKILVKGQGASPGVATGRVVVIRDVKDTGSVKAGDILVTKMTNPDMVPAMQKVAAIVTDEGGMTCHAAIVSRELGTPAVVGTRNATSILKPGQLITVDGEKGFIYEGALEKPAQAQAPAAAITASPLITATSVKVNVSIPGAAARAAATGADGVGLLRIEHLILGLNKTPGWFIANGREEEFIDELYKGIKIVLDAFNGKPVWVRTLDAPTDEFRNMAGGENEPHEHNPMLGWRGIRRDLQSPEQFRLQVEAFKRLWEKGYDNLGVMFPMVSHPEEFIAAREMMAEWGVDVNAATLGVMIEIPSCAIMIEDFIHAGIDFASFGTNDLVQYTLAIDRNNENVASMYQPKHPAVLALIDQAIEVCRDHGVECSICGQAGSEPPMVTWLVEHGITSVSANIDAIAKIRETVARTEQRIILESARRSHAE